jgi:Skp family chaperone for outer membrane proteins
MKAWTLAALTAFLVAGGLVISTGQGHAQKKGEKVDTTIGFVDLNRVMDQIKKTSTWVTETKKFDDIRLKFQGEIAHLTKVRYLTAAERGELDALRAKKSVSASEDARLKELENKSESLDKEAQTLAAVEKPTTEQAARIGDLSKLRQVAIANLQKETEDRSIQLQELEGKVLDDMQGKILEHVQTVAKNKGLILVLDQRAVLYGGQDLTDDVLLKLGAPKK